MKFKSGILFYLPMSVLIFSGFEQWDVVFIILKVVLNLGKLIRQFEGTPRGQFIVNCTQLLHRKPIFYIGTFGLTKPQMSMKIRHSEILNFFT